MRIVCVVVLVAGALGACGGDDAPRTAVGYTACHSVMHVGDSLTVGMKGENQIPDPAERLDSQYRAVGVADVRSDGGVGRTIHEFSNDQQPGVEVARQGSASVTRTTSTSDAPRRVG